MTTVPQAYSDAYTARFGGHVKITTFARIYTVRFPGGNVCRFSKADLIKLTRHYIKQGGSHGISG